MKTLDEVIKVFEMRCCQGCDECPYYPDDCLSYLDEPLSDALHYLKEYRSEKAMWEADRKGYLNWIEQYKEAREKHQQAVIELKKNPPLTWDELKQMEGKPVWVEERYRNGDLKSSGWWLIDFGNNDQVCIRDQGGNAWYAYRVSYGRDWQAYRKERK